VTRLVFCILRTTMQHLQSHAKRQSPETKLSSSIRAINRASSPITAILQEFRIESLRNDLWFIR
jgi:hypothetical protein